MAFGRKVTFGKKQLDMQQLGRMLREPDSDGVARVFSKELWDDPKIGALLRECGMNPDDERNRLPTAEDYIAMFAAAKERLKLRAEAYNRAMTERFGYCNATPFLVLGRPIWDGVHGAFLYAQMDLIGYDDWNIMMLAADERTRQLCGLPGNPVELPAITEAMTRRVVSWKQRYEFVLESFGITATGGDGISREQYDAAKDEIRAEIVAYVESVKPAIEAELRRAQA